MTFASSPHPLSTLAAPIYVCVCVCVCVFVCVCMYVCIYTHTYIHTYIHQTPQYKEAHERCKVIHNELSLSRFLPLSLSAACFWNRAHALAHDIYMYIHTHSRIYTFAYMYMGLKTILLAAPQTSSHSPYWESALRELGRNCSQPPLRDPSRIRGGHVL